MSEEFNRDFKGVWIPKEVWLDSRLNALDKIILTEIDSLDQSDKGCYASNKYIAEFCQCSETKVSTAISKLVKLGYLHVQKFDGRLRELKSSLSNFERQTFKNCKADSQNLKESNIESNIVINIEKKERKKAASSFDEIIAGYTSNDELKQALLEYIKMRKLMKKPLTDYALKRQLSTLDKLAKNDAEKVAVVDQSVTRGWLGLFPLKEEYKKQPAQQPQQETDYQRANRENAEKFAAMLGGGK